MSGIVGSYFNTRGSGVVAKLGTDGQIFTSTGLGLSQGFEAAAGGGKILQVQSVEKSDTFDTTTVNTSVDITGLTVDITPAATSSKILVLGTTSVGHDAAIKGAYLRLVRDSTVIFKGDTEDSIKEGVLAARVTATDEIHLWSGHVVDSPSSTSAVTYKLQLDGQAGTKTVNRPGATGEMRVSSSIVVMEIGA